jgi:lipid-binding SYLF domain-containing protein
MRSKGRSMNKRQFSLLVLTSLTLSATPAWADEYDDTIANFKKAEESSRFFANAYGYAVFPTIGKGGVGVGGAYGEGRVYEKGKLIGSTSMTQLSVGFQLGAQGFSQIIFFENQAALQKFTKGEFEFGAEASAVAITLAAGAKAGTTGATAGASVEKDKAKNVGNYVNGMAVFTLVKGGLMYEATVAGQKFKFKRA